jgi:hypothetical protein
MTRIRRSIAEELRSILPLLQKGPISVGELLGAFGHRGLALLSAVICTPFLLPIPIPGLSTVLCWIIIFSGLSIAVGRLPKVPHRWASKKITFPGQLFHRLESYAEKLERFIKPRFYPKSHLFDRLVGVMIVMAGVILGLPLPPPGNMIPSVAIILLCIGYLEADGIAVFLGITVLLTMITGLVFMADWITKYLGTLWG